MDTSTYSRSHYVTRDNAGIVYRAAVATTPGQFSPGKSANGYVQHTLEAALRKRRGLQRLLAKPWKAVVLERPDGVFEIGGYRRNESADTR